MYAQADPNNHINKKKKISRASTNQQLQEVGCGIYNPTVAFGQESFAGKWSLSEGNYHFKK